MANFSSFGSEPLAPQIVKSDANTDVYLSITFYRLPRADMVDALRFATNLSENVSIHIDQPMDDKEDDDE